jgi:hypothetical protein
MEASTMPATINLDDIDPEQRKQLGIRKPRESAFSKDELRGWSLKILALMASLSRTERDHVLRHASLDCGAVVRCPASSP